MRRYMHIICEILELGAAILVLIGILISGVGLLFHAENFTELFENISHFREYIEQILILVIGIEFLQMLCKPNSDNVLETLIFLVARHMIVGETNPYQDFVSVISIALLCVLRRYLHNTREDRMRREVAASADKNLSDEEESKEKDKEKDKDKNKAKTMLEKIIDRM